MRLIISASLFLFVASCLQETPPQPIPEVEVIINTIKNEYAPDKRVALFHPQYQRKQGQIILTGETNLPQAAAELRRQLSTLPYEWVDSLTLLPNTTLLEGRTRGIVNLSVCNIRSRPAHSAELSTQSTLGTPLTILDKQDDWYRVQTPDQYLGWLDAGGLTLCTEKEWIKWSDQNKLVINQDFQIAYEKPDLNARPVSDLIPGNILVKGKVGSTFTEVFFPDDRKGFIKNDVYTDYDRWLNRNNPTAEQVLQTAYQLLGRPYLWGGTSSRAMDCSGFTKTVYYLNGLLLPRDASQQVHTGQSIEADTELSNLKPGDLLFFGRAATDEHPEKITHVAIYIGQGEIIHATERVKIESLDPDASNFAPKRLMTYVRAKRFWNQKGVPFVPRLQDIPAYTD